MHVGIDKEYIIDSPMAPHREATAAILINSPNDRSQAISYLVQHPKLTENKVVLNFTSSVANVPFLPETLM